MVSITDIRSAVKSLTLSGQVVCLHSSLRSFGQLEGGAVALVDGFLSEDCTVLVPTFSDDFSIPPPLNIRPKRNGWKYDGEYQQTQGIGRIYDPSINEVTLEEMGAVPAEVLSRPHRVRGLHPLCSFTALGKQAEILIAGQTHQDIFAPIRALCEVGGFVVLIGVGLDKMTLLHAAEELAGRNPFIRWANDVNGDPIGVTMGGCSDGFGQLANTLSPLKRELQVGYSLWCIYPADQTLQASASKIRKNPEITHCSNPKCERCHDAILGGPILN